MLNKHHFLLCPLDIFNKDLNGNGMAENLLTLLGVDVTLKHLIVFQSASHFTAVERPSSGS